MIAKKRHNIRENSPSIKTINVEGYSNTQQRNESFDAISMAIYGEV